MMLEREQAEYILPLRWTSDEGLDDLTVYLTQLRSWIDVTVIDGSHPERFAIHAQAWGDTVRHVPVGNYHGLNGKVCGVLTGLEVARHDNIVIADDDVRYDRTTLATVLAGLRTSDLVKPQNYFQPAPWHARWDTARSLINRAFGSDYPGTYALRRSTLVECGGYDTSVLFENLEMERTIRCAGGIVSSRPDIFVVRRPPGTRHFFSQRVRHAYDSWAQPGRLLVEAAILPAIIWAARRPGRLLGAVALVIGIAEHGRRTNGGQSFYPRSSAAWAPLWVLERAVTSWVAIAVRVIGGVKYGDGRVSSAAHSLSAIRRRLSQGENQAQNHAFASSSNDRSRTAGSKAYVQIISSSAPVRSTNASS